MEIIKELSSGGIANSCSSSILNIFDVVKVRIQMNQLNPPIQYTSFLQSAKLIYTQEGWRGLLLPGLFASILREMSYSSIRFGLYAPIKNKFSEILDKNESLIVKFISGVSSGVIGSVICNPTDLVKIRLQTTAGNIIGTKYSTGLHKGLQPSYKGTIDAFIVIFKKEGLKGLYTGVSATATRAACLNGAQLSSYDHSKYIFKKHDILKEGPVLHVTASLIAGLCATTLGAPADLIKTKLLGQGSLLKYNGFIDCFCKTVRNEGLLGLFKGWTPSYLRIAPHFVIALPLYEQVRILMKLDHL